MRKVATVVCWFIVACGGTHSGPVTDSPGPAIPSGFAACPGLSPDRSCAVAGKPGFEVCTRGTVVCATTVISLTFDDALAQQLPAAATLEKHGMRGTFFLNTWRLRTSSADNMTAAQAKGLQDRGHEIGGHTLDHPHLTTLTSDQQRVQICNDRANLIGLGFDVQNFAYPFGDWNASARQGVADCGYNSARNVSGVSGKVAAETFTPKDALVLRAPTSVQTTDTVADLEELVTNAEKQGGWLLFTIHHVCDRCASNAIRPDDLDSFLGWLEQRSAQGTTTARVRDVIGGSTQPPVTWP
ncbi:MAG: polysaccharide deacetylase family protein [Myxococcales bacterium]